jgi:hypothetical protein
VSEAAQALLSTTEIRFEGSISKKVLPHTCLGIAELTIISLDMDDLARFAKIVQIVCPQLRRIRIHAPDPGLWVFEIAGKVALYRSKWTENQVSGSSWFRAIRPLSGILDVSINFRNIDFLLTSIYNVYEQDNIRTNRALVRACSGRALLGLARYHHPPNSPSLLVVFGVVSPKRPVALLMPS